MSCLTIKPFSRLYLDCSCGQLQSSVKFQGVAFGAGTFVLVRTLFVYKDIKLGFSLDRDYWVSAVFSSWKAWALVASLLNARQLTISCVSNDRIFLSST